MNRLITVLCLSIALSGCAGIQARPLHPGAFSPFDSNAYDVLKAAQVTIDNSRDQLAKGTLPASFKPIINDIDLAYKEAMPAYKLWHNAVSLGHSATNELVKLKSALAVLDSAVTAFKGAK